MLATKLTAVKVDNVSLVPWRNHTVHIFQETVKSISTSAFFFLEVSALRIARFINTAHFCIVSNVTNICLGGFRLIFINNCRGRGAVFTQAVWSLRSWLDDRTTHSVHITLLYIVDNFTVQYELELTIIFLEFYIVCSALVFMARRRETETEQMLQEFLFLWRQSQHFFK